MHARPNPALTGSGLPYAAEVANAGKVGPTLHGPRIFALPIELTC
jgi:hypothetical protein